MAVDQVHVNGDVVGRGRNHQLAVGSQNRFHLVFRRNHGDVELALFIERHVLGLLRAQLGEHGNRLDFGIVLVPVIRVRLEDRLRRLAVSFDVAFGQDVRPQTVRSRHRQVRTVGLAVPATGIRFEIFLGVELHPNGVVHERAILLRQMKANGKVVDLFRAVEDLVDLAVFDRLLFEVLHVQHDGIGVERRAILKSHPLPQRELIRRVVELAMRRGHVVFPALLVVRRLDQSAVDRVRGVEIRQTRNEDLDVRTLHQARRSSLRRIIDAQHERLDRRVLGPHHRREQQNDPEAGGSPEAAATVAKANEHDSLNCRARRCDGT